ncbi:MAG: hypothetical protein Q9224_002888, partial [Gallowayella concinna]
WIEWGGLINIVALQGPFILIGGKPFVPDAAHAAVLSTGFINPPNGRDLALICAGRVEQKHAVRVGPGEANNKLQREAAGCSTTSEKYSDNSSPCFPALEYVADVPGKDADGSKMLYKSFP